MAKTFRTKRRIVIAEVLGFLAWAEVFTLNSNFELCSNGARVFYVKDCENGEAKLI
jgi:hypothetical protein